MSFRVLSPIPMADWRAFSSFMWSRVFRTTVFRGERRTQPSPARTRPHLLALSLALLNTRKGEVRARWALLRKIGMMIVPIQLTTTAVEKFVGKSLIALNPPEMMRREKQSVRSFTMSAKYVRMLNSALTVDRNL